jgi:phosphate transport system permease protein
LRGRRRFGDQLFRGLAAGSGIAVVALVTLVGAFLLIQAIPALANDKASFLTSREWAPGGTDPRFGIVDLLWTTVLSSAFAMLIAVPVAIGVALFLAFHAPRRLAGPFARMIDLLAAVPSIVFGLWGVLVLGPKLTPITDFLTEHLGWFPLFRSGVTAGSVFTGSIVLAIMVLPIVTAISREVFAQTPTSQLEGALALGATRWEVVRTAVLPFGRAGVVSGAMLGLGRAFGETIAISFILSSAAPGSPFNPSLFAGGETFASKIANNAAEFDSPQKTGAYIAAGLVLFVLTFLVNAVARVIVERKANQ